MRINCFCEKSFIVEENIGRVSRYENKPVLKARSKAGEIIKKEIFYYYICPNCDREVVQIHRYSINAIGEWKKVEKETLSGWRASEYLKKTERTRKYSKIDALKVKAFGKGIPLVYYKSINDETQKPYYLNDASSAGAKVVNKVKLLSI